MDERTRIAVTGGREYNDRAAIYSVLDQVSALFQSITIVHGCAPGLDSIAGEWAIERNHQEERHPANWNKHGKAAGFIRNSEMIDTKPDLLISFPGGNGTKHCTQYALKKQVTVLYAIEIKELNS